MTLLSALYRTPFKVSIYKCLFLQSLFNPFFLDFFTDIRNNNNNNKYVIYIFRFIFCSLIASKRFLMKYYLKFFLEFFPRIQLFYHYKFSQKQIFLSTSIFSRAKYFFFFFFQNSSLLKINKRGRIAKESGICLESLKFQTKIPITQYEV